jgi:hypothetical protein
VQALGSDLFCRSHQPRETLETENTREPSAVGRKKPGRAWRRRRAREHVSAHRVPGRTFPARLGIGHGESSGSARPAQGQLWGSFGRALGELWESFGRALGELWESFGGALGELRVSSRGAAGGTRRASVSRL